MAQRDPRAMISRPAVRYYGGKFRLRCWILYHFPDHDSYAEPFAGASSVLLAKWRVRHETINDLDGSVVAFFRCLRDRRDDLLEYIRWTPFSREESDGATDAEDLPDLERARRLYVRCQQRFAGDPGVTWRQQPRDPGCATVATTFASIDHLHAVGERLRGVAIERMDALAFCARYGAQAGQLLYVDPPYLDETRSRPERGYAHEFQTPEKHRELAEVLLDLPSMIALSGYPSGLYQELFESAGWERSDSSARKEGNMPSTECLWCNPALVAARSEYRQGHLWAEAV